MTRIFGYQAQPFVYSAELVNLRDRLITRVGQAIKATYIKNEPWQASRLGILMCLDDSRLFIERNLIGYQQINGTLKDNISLEAMELLQGDTPPETVVVCLMNEPDYGFEHFSREYPIFNGPDPRGLGEKFYVEPFDGLPIDDGIWDTRLSHPWTVFTMGSWYSKFNTTSEESFLVGAPKPSYALLNYLRTLGPVEPDFSWINPNRNPLVLAYYKTSGILHFHDGYNPNTQTNNSYIIKENDAVTEFCGLENARGEII